MPPLNPPNAQQALDGWGAAALRMQAASDRTGSRHGVSDRQPIEGTHQVLR